MLPNFEIPNVNPSPISVPTYIHNLPVQIGEWEINAPIGFSERLGVGFNILGRKGIFDQFQVCFNNHARKVTFQKIYVPQPG